MTSTQRITRPAYLKSLTDFREFLKEHCAGQAGVSAKIYYDIQLAVDEACTNVITHGYADMDPGSIILEIEIDPAKIVISITDFGPAFEPDSAPIPDLNTPIEEREPGGFGLYFIRQSVDEMNYRATEDGNTMTLIKYLGKPTGD